MNLEVKDTITLSNGQVIKIAKINKLDISVKFREACLPICYAQFRPLEGFIAALVNQFAPMDDWGLVNSVITSDKEIDEQTVKALDIIAGFYAINKEEINLDSAYELVYAQIQVEKILEHSIRRKLVVIKDIARIMNFNIDWNAMMTTAELAITKKLIELKTRTMARDERLHLQKPAG